MDTIVEKIEDYSLNKENVTKCKKSISKVGIIGAGMVGRSIARMVSRNGLDVVFIELSADRIKNAYEELSKDLDSMIAHWGMTESEKRAIISRISSSTECNALIDCDIVIEAIKSKRREEIVDDRKKIFKKIENVVSKDTIIATNSTTQVITEMASGLNYPERCLSLHFISMEPDARMVEVVKGIHTSKEAYDKTKYFAELLNKEVIPIKEYPGVISTRLFVPLINEACQILMQGISEMTDIDKTMKIGFGTRLGPFEMADKIGLDKILRWAENLYDEFGDLKYKASPLIKKHVRANHLGRVNGKGFYEYDDQGNKTPVKHHYNY